MFHCLGSFYSIMQAMKVHCNVVPLIKVSASLDLPIMLSKFHTPQALTWQKRTIRHIRTHKHHLMFSHCCVLGDFSASDTSLADLHERQRPPPPELGLMPLPDTDTDSGLDWTHLVDVASAFEGERRPQRSEPLSLLFISSPQLCHSFAQSTCPSFIGGRVLSVKLKLSVSLTMSTFICLGLIVKGIVHTKMKIVINYSPSWRANP